ACLNQYVDSVAGCNARSRSISCAVPRLAVEVWCQTLRRQGSSGQAAHRAMARRHRDLKKSNAEPGNAPIYRECPQGREASGVIGDLYPSVTSCLMSGFGPEQRCTARNTASGLVDISGPYFLTLSAAGQLRK